jgi:hypothetical protein
MHACRQVMRECETSHSQKKKCQVTVITVSLAMICLLLITLVYRHKIAHLPALALICAHLTYSRNLPRSVLTISLL